MHRRQQPIGLSSFGCDQRPKTASGKSDTVAAGDFIFGKSKAKAAQQLGLNRTGFFRLLHQFGIESFLLRLLRLNKETDKYDNCLQ